MPISLLKFDDYPPIYKNAGETLIENLKNEQCFSVQKEIFERFCKHFSVVPKLWKEWIFIEYEATCKPLTGYEYRQKCKKMVEKFIYESEKHFYIEPEVYEKYHNLLDRPFRQLLTFPNFEKISTWIVFKRFRHISFLKRALTYPHSKLNEILEIYKRRCDAPITKELLQKQENAKKMYERIMGAKSQIEWLNLLLESEDYEFIVENIEAQLSQNPCCTEIWFFYFNYLERRNDIRILKVCQRYCRLFIEDTKMLKFYVEKVEKFKSEGSEVGYWINDLTEFYQYFKTENIIPKLLQNFTPHFLMEQKEKADDSCRLEKIRNQHPEIFYNTFNYFNQEFSLPKTQIYYILNNLNIEIYRNLIQTCKYFFNQKKILPIWHLELRWMDQDCFHQNSVYLGTLDNKEENEGTVKERHRITFKNDIWLEESLEIFAEFHLFDKIYQSDIRYLRIQDCNITLNQYDLLVKSEKIREIDLFSMEIICDDKKGVALERLLKFLPNAYEISLIIKSIKIESTTSQNLSELKRNSKLVKFSINNCTDAIEPNLFCRFLKDNITSNSSVKLQYINQTNDDYRNAMKAAVKTVVETFTEGNQSPKIQLFF